MILLQHTAHSRKKGEVSVLTLQIFGRADRRTELRRAKRKERKGGGGLWKKKGVNAPDFLFLFLSLPPPFFRTTAVSLRQGETGGGGDLTKV